jgi:hypothetical protein
LFNDETNHGLSLKDIQERAIEQALMQCANPSGALAKACIEKKKKLVLNYNRLRELACCRHGRLSYPPK